MAGEYRIEQGRLDACPIAKPDHVAAIAAIDLVVAVSAKQAVVSGFTKL